LGGTTFIFPLLGVSARDDVVERRNTAASYAVGGALLGVTMCFAGANVGSGPGPEVVFFCAILSTAAFFFLWFVLESIAHPSEAITVDRDEEAAVRLAGFLVATGILLGGAVAGNWESPSGTLQDFCTFGWPAIVLLIIALTWERINNASTHTIRHGRWKSYAAASFYIIASLAWVLKRGRP
jgi:uncharacterized membrane protein YjfL (UPF0719 family)